LICGLNLDVTDCQISAKFVRPTPSPRTVSGNTTYQSNQESKNQLLTFLRLHQQPLQIRSLVPDQKTRCTRSHLVPPAWFYNDKTECPDMHWKSIIVWNKIKRNYTLSEICWIWPCHKSARW